MAGEIQLNSTTFATESGGTVTIANVDSATNRQNLGLEIGVDVQQFDSDTTKNDVANTFTANQTISVTDNTNAALSVTQLGTGNALIVNDEGSDTTPFVIDASGKVGIGTSNPNSALTVKGNVAGSPNIGDAVQFGGSGGYASIEMSGSTGGIIDFNAGDGTDFKGRILYDINNDVLDFQVNSALRMRIDSNGHIWAPTNPGTDPWAATSGTFLKLADGYPIGATSQSNIVAIFNRNTSSGTIVEFKYNASVVGSIYTNGTTTTYVTSSDYRLKENIINITDGITRVKQLNPSRFNFIADPDNTVDGFIAHEVSDVVPEAITGEKDAVDEDGGIVPQGIDQSKLVPLLTAALQESIALIESQQSQIDALTARIEALETA